MMAHHHWPQNWLVEIRTWVISGSFCPVFPNRLESWGTRKVRKTNIRTIAEAKTIAG